MEDKGDKGRRTPRATVKAPGTTAPRKSVAAKPSTAAKSAAEAGPATPKKATAVRKATVKPALPKLPSGAPDRAEMVRMAAFFRAERRGFTPGYEVEDWLAAEVEVANKLGAGARKPAAG